MLWSSAFWFDYSARNWTVREQSRTVRLERRELRANVELVKLDRHKFRASQSFGTKGAPIHVSRAYTTLVVNVAYTVVLAISLSLSPTKSCLTSLTESGNGRNSSPDPDPDPGQTSWLWGTTLSCQCLSQLSCRLGNKSQLVSLHVDTSVKLGPRIMGTNWPAVSLECWTDYHSAFLMNNLPHCLSVFLVNNSPHRPSHTTHKGICRNLLHQQVHLVSARISPICRNLSHLRINMK